MVDSKIVDVIRAREEDAASLSEFASRSFRDAFGEQNNPSDLEKFLATAYGFPQQLKEIRDTSVDTFIAWEGNNVAGFVQVREGSSPDCVKTNKAIELQRLYVERQRHGLGVAATLMDVAKQAARKRNGTALWLGVWERNPRAQAFYRKHGFVAVGTHVFVVGTDPQTDIVMQCALV